MPRGAHSRGDAGADRGADRARHPGGELLVPPAPGGVSAAGRPVRRRTGAGGRLRRGPPGWVVGLDDDAITAAHVAARYPQVLVVRGNLVHLPLPDGALDVV